MFVWVGAAAILLGGHFQNPDWFWGSFSMKQPKTVNIYPINTTVSKVSKWCTSARFVAKNKNVCSFYNNWMGGHFHNQ